MYKSWGVGREVPAKYTSQVVVELEFQHGDADGTTTKVLLVSHEDVVECANFLDLCDNILSCKAASADEFDTSFRGPFSGISWAIFSLTFFLACAEIVFDFYFEHAFDPYSVFLVTFTLIWLARFYAYFRSLKHAILDLRTYTDTLNLKDVPASKRTLLEEAQRGNTETLVDKRDDLSSL